MPQNNKIRFNNTDYEFDIILRNSGGEIVLPRELFREMQLEESFLNWASRGYLVYDNANERLERYKKGGGKVKNQEYFYYRMDGTDTIEILFKPVQVQPTGSAKIQYNGFTPEEMFIKFKGIIYDSEDISKQSITNKLKKLYFWDENYHKAMALNTRVSSGEYLMTYGGRDDVADLNNGDRQVYTGDMVRYIVEDKMGAVASADQWDVGTRKTLYTSAPNSTVYNDLTSMVDMSVSDEKFPTWFSYDRFKEEFIFISYKKLFERYLTDDRERLDFHDSSVIDKSVKPPRFLIDRSFHVNAVSDISAYKYTKMAPMDNMKEIVSRSITRYDTGGKRFITKSEEGHIENAKAVYEELIIDFPLELNNPKFVINADKSYNKSIIETQSCEAASVLKDTVKAGVLFNDAISISALGLTSRAPGKFIDIASQTDTQGIWEDIFLGAWLMLSVTHKITVEGYTNEILAIKPNMAKGFSYPVDAELLEGLE